MKICGLIVLDLCQARLKAQQQQGLPSSLQHSHPSFLPVGHDSRVLPLYVGDVRLSWEYCTCDGRARADVQTAAGTPSTVNDEPSEVPQCEYEREQAGVVVRLAQQHWALSVGARTLGVHNATALRQQMRWLLSQQARPLCQGKTRAQGTNAKQKEKGQ